MGKFKSRKCQTPILEALLGLCGRSCVLPWDAPRGRSHLDLCGFALLAQGLGVVEPELIPVSYGDGWGMTLMSCP